MPTYKPVGVDENSLFPPRVQSQLSATFVPSVGVVTNAVAEWWIHPIVIHDEARRRYIGTGVGADNGDGMADVVAWEMSYSGVTRRYKVGEVIVDDHNVANLSILPWGGILVTWNNHNEDHIFRAKLSNEAGDLVTLVTATEFASNTTFPLSYGQMHLIEHLSDEDGAVLWNFVRLYRGDGWAWEVLEITVDRATRAITRSAPKRFLSGRTNQAYTTTAVTHDANGDQIIRAVLGFNPSAPVHSLHAFEIHVESGAITSLTDGAVGNIVTATDVPIFYDEHTPLVPTTDAGDSRRLFYVRGGDAEWAILHADWATATPDEADYTVRVRNPGSGASVSVGGYIDTPDSAALDPAVNGCGMELIGLDLAVGSIAANKEIARRWASSSERMFQWEVTPTGYLHLAQLTRSNGSSTFPADFTSTAAVPNIFTEEVSVKWRWWHNGTNGVIQFFYSTDLGENWTQLGSDVNAGSYALLDDAVAPLVIGTSNGTDQVAFTVQAGRFFSWDGSTETTLAGIDFRTENDPTETTFTGDGGETWTFQGSVQLLGGWVVSSLGTAGPRVGFTANANYIGGCAFTVPAKDDDCILVTRRNAGDTQSALERWVRDGSTWVLGETLATSEHYLSRPLAPVGGGFAKASVSQITEYSPTDYVSYEGDIHLIA